jgi:adenylate kinase
MAWGSLKAGQRARAAGHGTPDMRLILLGPPGSGKGTQAKLLAQRLDLAHIATGDILREAVRLKTPLGEQARPFMEKGQYVSDQLVNDIVAERFRRADRPLRFLMDGYPRTLAQAQSFDAVLAEQGLPLDRGVLLATPDDAIVLRISGRRTCPKCQATYHVQFNPPAKKADHCDRCDTPLTQRADDRGEAVRERLRVYHATMPAVIDHYRRQGLLREVRGEGSIDAIFASIMEALQAGAGTC